MDTQRQAESAIRKVYRDELLINPATIQPWKLLGSDGMKALRVLEHIVPPHNVVTCFQNLSPRKHPEHPNHFIADIPRSGDFFGEFRCNILPKDQEGPYEIRLLVAISYPRDPVLRQQYLDGLTDDKEWMFHDETIDNHWVNIDTIKGHKKLQGQSIFNFSRFSYFKAHPLTAFRVEVCFNTEMGDPTLYQMEIEWGYISPRFKYSNEENSLVSRELIKKYIGDK